MMHRMTTTNPRLTITLQPSTAAQIRALSRLTGNSQSAVISELLETSGPVFDRLIRVLTAAEQAKNELTSKVSDDLAKAQSRIERQLGLVLDDMDETTRPILDAAEGIRRRAARQTAGASPEAPTATKPPRVRFSTPLSNRGVRSDPTNSRSRPAGATKRARQGGGKS